MQTQKKTACKIRRSVVLCSRLKNVENEGRKLKEKQKDTKQAKAKKADLLD